jgi:DNA-binding NarL/FixJ family response regulator
MTTDLSLIRILTVDDHPLLRKGIAALVNAETDMKLVAEASNGEEAIEKFRSHRPDVTLMELVDHPRDDLTPREIDVLRLIANGNANKQIADQLSIGEASVKSYVANILSKLGASDRAHAVTIGLKRGIIELEIP